MASLFTKIINGDIPAHKIMEDDRYLAFLDIKPINPGHTLVIPKGEGDYVFDMPDHLLGGLMIFAKKAALKIQSQINCKRIGVVICGLEVPHTHIHLIPINSIDDINFANGKPATDEELSEVAGVIRSADL